MALANFVLKLRILADVVEETLKNKECKTGRQHQHYISLSQVVFPILFQSQKVAFSILSLRNDQVDVVKSSQLIHKSLSFYLNRTVLLEKWAFKIEYV